MVSQITGWQVLMRRVMQRPWLVHLRYVGQQGGVSHVGRQESVRMVDRRRLVVVWVQRLLRESHGRVMVRMVMQVMRRRMPCHRDGGHLTRQRRDVEATGTWVHGARGRVTRRKT